MTRTLGISTMAAVVLMTGCRAAPDRVRLKACRDDGFRQNTNAVVGERIALWKVGDNIETDDLIRLQVRDGQQARYRVLGGPNPAGGMVQLKLENTRVASMVADQMVGRTMENTRLAFMVADGMVGPTMENTQVAFMVAGGWIYMSGNWPSGTTLRVSAAAEGTRMILQEENNVHRVFFLGDWPSKVRVVLKEDKDHPKLMTTARTYIEVGPDDHTLPDPKPIAQAPDEIQKFVAYVEDLVEIAK